MTRLALAPTPKPERLIKSRQRVRDLAEVYTASSEVNAMLDLVDTGDPATSAFDALDTTFLEPSAGNGNFLVEILRRKLRLAQYRELGNVRDFEFACLRALASTYGIDICQENVDEARQRVLAVLEEHYLTQVVAFFPDQLFLQAAREIVRTNILLGDTLHGVDRLYIVEYKPYSRRQFRRIVHPFAELLAPVASQQSRARRLDRVSYRLLADRPAELGTKLVSVQ